MAENPKSPSWLRELQQKIETEYPGLTLSAEHLATSALATIIAFYGLETLQDKPLHPNSGVLLSAIISCVYYFVIDGPRLDAVNEIKDPKEQEYYHQTLVVEALLRILNPLVILAISRDNLWPYPEQKLFLFAFLVLVNAAFLAQLHTPYKEDDDNSNNDLGNWST